MSNVNLNEKMKITSQPKRNWIDLLIDGAIMGLGLIATVTVWLWVFSV